MEQAAAVDLARQGIEVAITVILPLLATALFVGVLVSIFQALTQVQEMTLTFVPKLAGVALVLTLLGNWMLTTVVAFMQHSFMRIGDLGHF
jgi:flagellar biosynthetic protein FliQ